MAVIRVRMPRLVQAKYRTYPFEELSDPLPTRRLAIYIESPIFNDTCGVVGCTRLIGHPERDWEVGMHVRIEGDFFSIWPIGPKWRDGKWDEGADLPRGMPIS